MWNLDVKETIQKIKKTKSEIKKKLEESIANSKKNENGDMQEKVNVCTTNENAVKVIQEFEDITKYFESLRKKNLLLAWFFEIKRK